MSDAAASKIEVITGRVGLALAARQLVEHARYGVCLLTDALDPATYGTEAFGDAVKRFVLHSHHNRVRVLVGHPEAAARGHHALVDLGRIVSSRIEFRELLPEHHYLRDEQMIVDGCVLLNRLSAQSLEARLTQNDPRLARELQRRFDQLWEESPPAQELRRLAM